MASGTRKRLIIGVIAAVVALLTVATTVFAAGFGGRHNFAAPGGNNRPANGKPGSMGQADRGFGPRAIVTAVDTTNQTITLGGLPQQIATVKVDQTVKLVTIQPDGTTKDATITNFTTGSLVEVHFKFNGRGKGRGPSQPGNAPSQPSTGSAQPMVNVTELALVPAGQVHVAGLVTITGGTLTIVDSSGLQLTINTANAKVTKGTATANVTDIKVGDRIMITGTQNGATVNAATIRLFDPSAMKPGMRPGMKPGAGSPAAPPSA
jgi:hypothetical protein